MGKRPLGPWVVVGVDTSADSLAALDVAAAVAATRQLRLRIVATVPVSTGSESDSTGSGEGVAAAAAANRAVAQAARRVHQDRPDLTVRTLVVTGDPASTLIRASYEAGVVFVAGRGRGGAPPDDNCAVVAAHALCPTVIVPSDVDISMGAPVLVAVEALGRDDAAVGFAFEEAAARGVPVRAAHVWAGPYEPRTSWAAADQRVAEALAGWVEKYPRVPVQRLPLHDANPARALLLASSQAGLVVLGARLPTRYSGQLLGTVTRVLVEHAECPVCVMSARVG